MHQLSGIREPTEGGPVRRSGYPPLHRWIATHHQGPLGTFRPLSCCSQYASTLTSRASCCSRASFFATGFHTGYQGHKGDESLAQALATANSPSAENRIIVMGRRLSLLQWNVCSIRCKLYLLRDAADPDSTVVVLLQETLLLADRAVSLKGYRPFHLHAVAGESRECSILVRNTIPFSKPLHPEVFGVSVEVRAVTPPPATTSRRILPVQWTACRPDTYDVSRAQRPPSLVPILTFTTKG